jgi:hypothetical protein
LVETLAGFAGEQFVAGDGGYDVARMRYKGLIG